MDLILVKNGVTQKTTTGYDLPVLFFGPFTLLVRGQWRLLLLWVVLAAMTVGIATPVLLIVFPTFTKRSYVRQLVVQGWSLTKGTPPKWWEMTCAQT